MQGITFEMYGPYGHFKRPENNDNPISFSFMHKVALIGLIGAVVGIDRKDMFREENALCSQLCDDFLYAICVREKIVKEAHFFTKRKTLPSKNFDFGRRSCELIKNPNYEITVALKEERSKEIFETFCDRIRKDQNVYPKYFGIVSCPAELKYIADVEISEEKQGEFETRSIFSAQHEIVCTRENLDLVFEWIPTHSSQNFYYTPERYVQTVCPQNDLVKVMGPYRLVNKEKSIWFL